MAKVSFTTKDGRRVSFTTKSKSRGSTKSKKRRTKSTKRSTPKRRKSPKKRRTASKGSSRSTRSTGSKKMAGKKGGTKGSTRVKKLLIGLGVGVAVSTVATLARTPEIEASGPVIDALVGGGVEAQIGTAIPRLIRQVVLRSGGFGNGSNGLALEGA